MIFARCVGPQLAGQALLWLALAHLECALRCFLLSCNQCHPVFPACHILPSGPQYEPELFPGLIYRMKDPKIVLLIFVSGKVVLTGRGAALAQRTPRMKQPL